MKAFDITKLVRENILALKPYSSARDEFSGCEGVFLDANENPFGTLNRYPDPHQKALKAAVSRIKKIPAENIFLGNGSDEVIDLIYRVFAESGRDKVIICPPTYGMYEVSAHINDVEIITVNLSSDFQLDIDEILKYWAKCVFVCSPNNPTGNRLERIHELLEHFEGIVVVDEAYIDFCPETSLLPEIERHPNLIVMQTFSKAWALAGVRVGMAFAQKTTIDLLSKTKPPYNISALNQQAALSAIENVADFEKRRKLILEQRAVLEKELKEIACVKKIYPSDANFLLVEVSDADAVYQKLVNHKVITRNRNSQIKNCIRITVGSPEENNTLLCAMKKLEI
ncbi:MAG: histidinol-phosphate transaminase [Dysgonamonadaceae bacterium]|jgi:histidinol-phosphate aminotransferase|nr:histidinol-phosphate transaminase [Dysgonamonadaceae bacterium]